MSDHELHTWDGTVPLACRLDGDHIYAEVDVPRLLARQASRVDDLEREKRLYLRLAGLVAQGRDGTVRMARGWQKGALEFANLYAPPVDYTSFRLLSRDGLPLTHFAVEALLIWWTLHLQHNLAERGSLAEALGAVVQIRNVFPVAQDDGLVTMATSEWVRLLSSFRPDLSARQVSREQWFPPTSHEVGSLPPREQSRVVDELRQQHNADEAKLWAIAHNVFCTVVNVRLSGVTLACLPTGGSRSARPSVGFTFLTPLGRIWYGLWEDLGGLRLRRCAHCGGFLLPSRADQRYHEACYKAAKTARHRARRKQQAAAEPSTSRTPRPSRRTSSKS